MSLEETNVGDVRPTSELLRDNLSEMQVRSGVGALVATFAQQIDYAKYMARGREAVPKHLRENVGACLAVVDIATRFNFSPYMVANKTYVQKDRLCFESQLVHAMLEQSGVLKQRLRFEYSGEGETRRVKVIGHFKREIDPFVYESPMLKDLHPGHTTKDGIRYVAGSQLWDDKPDVQLIYNATYDLVRIYAPDVLMAMGIPAPDQTPEDEHRYVGPDNAKDVTSHIERLGTTAAAGDEGGHPAHIATELDNIAADKGVVDVKAEVVETKTVQAEPSNADPAAETKPKRKRGDPKEKPAAALLPLPKTIKEWDPYARQKIDMATESKPLKLWWTSDLKLRNALGITKEDRMPVEAEYIDKIIKLEDAEKDNPK